MAFFWGGERKFFGKQKFEMEISSTPDYALGFITYVNLSGIFYC